MKRHATLFLVLLCSGSCVDTSLPLGPNVSSTGGRGGASDARGGGGSPVDLADAEKGGSGGHGGAGGEPGSGGMPAPDDGAPVGGSEDVGPGLDMTMPAGSGGAPGTPDADRPEVAAPMDLPPPPPPNQAPVIATAAAATPEPVIGTTTTLSVLGSDDQGEAALVYTWATKGAAPGPVGYSTNGDNTAKTVTALFTAAGAYTFEVVVRDTNGLATTSSIFVLVAQAPNDLSISPTMVALAAGGMQQFTAKGFDQFGAALALQITPSWSLVGTCGTLSNSGLLVAAVGASTTCTVVAAIGGASDPASVTVGGAAPMVLAPVADAHVEESNPDRNFGRDSILQVKTQNDSDNDRIAYLRFSFAGLGFSKAILRLYGRSAGGAPKQTLLSVSDLAWSETAITWKNRPGLGTARGTVPMTTTAKYREWDVTAALQYSVTMGLSQVSFALRMDGTTGESPDTFNAREASSNPPQLVLTP